MTFKKNYFSEETMHHEGRQEAEGTEIVVDFLKQNNQQEGEQVNLLKY
jgi:hypothetical protein